MGRLRVSHFQDGYINEENVKRKAAVFSVQLSVKKKKQQVHF